MPENNNQETCTRVVFEWTQKALDRAMDAVRLAIQNMNNEIVVATPVDTGFMRSSYFASVNVIPSGQGGAGTAAINAVAMALKPGDIYYLGNVAVYARRVEYGYAGTDSLGRTYNQPGRFWMANVVDRASIFLSEAAQEVAGRE